MNSENRYDIIIATFVTLLFIVVLSSTIYIVRSLAIGEWEMISSIYALLVLIISPTLSATLSKLFDYSFSIKASKEERVALLKIELINVICEYINSQNLINYNKLYRVYQKSIFYINVEKEEDLNKLTSLLKNDIINVLSDL